MADADVAIDPRLAYLTKVYSTPRPFPDQVNDHLARLEQRIADLERTVSLLSQQVNRNKKLTKEKQPDGCME